MGLLSSIGSIFSGGSSVGSAISTGLQAVGTGMDIYSKIKGGSAQEQMYQQQASNREDYYEALAEERERVAEENAKISRYDATIYEEQAEQLLFQTEVSLRRHNEAVNQLIGSQKAAYGAAGVHVGSGSPLEVVAKTAGKGARDAMYIKYNGQTAASHARDVAKRYRMLADAGLREAAGYASIMLEAGADEAAMLTSQGSQAKTASTYGAISSGLRGAYNIGSSQGWW